MNTSTKTSLSPNDRVKKLVALSSIAQLVGQVINALAGVVIVKTMTTSLGVQNYGIYTTILAFVSTFALFTDLGLNGITGRDIAKKPEDAHTIIGHNMGLRLFLCLIVVPVIVLTSYAFYPHSSQTFHLGILIVATYLFFDSIRAVSLAYFMAKIRNDIAALVGIIQQLSFLGLVIIAAFHHSSIIGYLTAYVISNIFSTLAALYLVRKQVAIKPQINIAIWRGIMARSITLGTIIVINVLYLKADSIMLSVISGTQAVAIYGIAYSLILMIMAIPSYLMGALIPSMTTAKKDDFARLVQKAFHIMIIFSCLMIAGSFAIKDSVILVIANEHFTSAANPFFTLAIASGFSAIASVFGFASVSVNKHHKMLYASIICLVVNIGINFILIPRYSYNGAAWATVISEIISVLSMYYIFHRETGVTINIRHLLKPLLAMMLVIISILYLGPLWQTSSALCNTLLNGAYATVLYSALLYVSDAFPADIKHFIDNKLRRIF